jgi:hypothetical protein
VRDTQECHQLRFLVDPIQDSIGPTTGAERAGQFPFEGLADPLRRGREVTEDELDDRWHDARRNALENLAAPWR